MNATEGGIILEAGDLLGDFVGEEEVVVGVEKGDEVAVGGLDAAVSGGGGALVFLGDIAQAVLVGCQEGGGFVGGTVVYDDDFHVGIGLLEDAV